MIHWKHSLVLLLSLANPVQALQVVDAHDGETVLAKISRKEVTRVAFENGRVQKVTGNAGEFVLEKDDEKGQVFIRPADPQSAKPINVFLTSPHSTVALLLQPVDTPSDTIVIREPQARAQVRSLLESSGRHVRTCKNLLLALAGDTLPEDMEAREPGQAVALWPNTRLTLQRMLLGASVVGEKYQLANTGTADLAIAEPDLFKPGVMAVSVEHASLRPGSATNLFVIRERRSDD
jgi:conjugal transfer pilus assembly protein TraK